MNIGLQTGAVDQSNDGVYWFVQSNLPGQIDIAHHFSQGPVLGPQQLFAEKLRGLLQGTFGDAPYGIDLSDTAKIGQQVAAA